LNWICVVHTIFCVQVLASNNLARLLQRMLVVGNIMNEGTRRGGASGFTLDSLIKMVNTKGETWQEPLLGPLWCAKEVPTFR
jgi:hypothetical protein